MIQRRADMARMTSNGATLGYFWSYCNPLLERSFAQNVVPITRMAPV